MRVLSVLAVAILISCIAMPTIAQKDFDGSRSLGNQQYGGSAQTPTPRGPSRSLGPRSPGIQSPTPGYQPGGAPQYVEVFTCSNCNKEVSNSATSCPYCKVSFDESGGPRLRGRLSEN